MDSGIGESATHVGAMVQAELRRQERQVAWLARRLHCDRTNVYKIFRKADLDTHLLRRISVALSHDFFADLSRCYGLSTVDVDKL